MKYVYMCGGYGAPEGGIYKATDVPENYRAAHPDYVCLQFPDFPDKPKITCHKAVVFDTESEALLLAIQNIDKRIKAKLEELKLGQQDLQGLIKARVRFFEEYEETKAKEAT